MAVTAVMAQPNVVEQRRAGYKQMGEVMQAMKAAVDSNGDFGALVPRVQAMLAFSHQIPSLFPPGSGEGMGETKALPAIWTDNATFQGYVRDLTAQTERLLVAMNSGDRAAFVREFQATGRVCATCHRSFRAR